MLKRSRTDLPVITVFLISVSWVVALAQTKPSGSSRAQTRFEQAVDWTSHKGLHAKLPPHIATLLGLSEGEECPVMQSMQRSGTTVRGFDVASANQGDVILFVVDETANDQTLYLASAEGRLRRVVSVKAGKGRVLRITDKEREGFQKEKQFWLDRLAPEAGAK